MNISNVHETPIHKRPVTTKTHGILDYVVGVVLFLAPNIFGFAHIESAAVWVPRMIGAIVILQALVTSYELGALKLMPMRLHLINDYLAGAFLAASPWLLGFFDSVNQRLWVPHLIVGLGILLVTSMTEKNPRSLSLRSARHHGATA